MYIFPFHYEGCKSSQRVNLSRCVSYDDDPYRPQNEKVINFSTNFESIVWEFDTKENRDEALQQIDNFTKNSIIQRNPNI